jgi:hypothetical protein
MNTQQAYAALQRLVKRHNKFCESRPAIRQYVAENPTYADVQDYVMYEFDRQGRGTVAAADFPEMVKTVLVSAIIMEIPEEEEEGPWPEPEREGGGQAQGWCAWCCGGGNGGARQGDGSPEVATGAPTLPPSV